MLGDATPNLSIRVRSTLYEFWIALSASAFRKLFNSPSELLALITDELSFVAKKLAIGVPAPVALYSLMNKSINDVFVVFAFVTAVSKALLKLGSFGLLAKLAISSFNAISIVTFIPPFKSKPRASSFAFASR